MLCLWGGLALAAPGLEIGSPPVVTEDLGPTLRSCDAGDAGDAAACGASADAAAGGEPSLWVEGRWRVASETIDRNAPLVLTADDRELVTPAWQIEAVLDCRRVGKPRKALVDCAIEAAALRLVTFDHWQRPADRQIVEQLLGSVEAALARRPLRIRAPEPGAVRTARRQPDRTRLAAVLFDDVADAFALEPPAEGFAAATRWQTTGEPLLEVPLDQAMRPVDPAVHRRRGDGDRAVVDTSGAAEKVVLTPERGRYEYRSTTWRTPESSGRTVARRDVPESPVVTSTSSRSAYPGRVTLQAEAIVELSPEPGRLVQRTWRVTGTGSARSHRAGRIERLADDAEAGLGPSRQVADPAVARGRLPQWTSILDERP